jgi:hypothetical protein
MNWDYVAGLFDGEGCVSFQVDGKKFTLRIVFTCSDENVRELLIDFLKDNDIHCVVVPHKNKLGSSVDVAILRWDSIRLLLDGLLKGTIVKRKHLEIAGQILALRDKAKAEGLGAMLEHGTEFDVLRHKLHSLAKKGRKDLKQWHTP